MKVETSDPLRHLEKMAQEAKERRENDTKKYQTMDEALCMICHAHGEDKRSFRVSCMYQVTEVIPEALDLEDAYYLRLCKACRGEFLGALKGAADKRRHMREIPKDHDGNPEHRDADRNIPMRVNGAVVMMTREEYEAYKKA